MNETETLEYDGLCDSDYFVRTGQADHWKGSYTRNSLKGPVTVSWNHVSASQVETYQKCPRLWFFKSVQKLPESQKGHQSLGEAFHLCMEKVPESGIWPDRGDVNASPDDWDKAIAMAKNALPLLPVPPPGKFFKREHGIKMETYPGGPTFVGYIDLAIPEGVGWPAFLVPPNEKIINDYKTLSDFRYIKTPAELADSVQMMSYAKWAITPGALDTQEETLDLTSFDPGNVRLIHMYARTKAPFNRNSIRDSSALVTPEQINAKWENTLDTVREMEQIASRNPTDANEVHAGGALNGHCDAYGGCSFRDKCGLAKPTGLKALFQITKKPATDTTTITEENQMAGSSVLDKIRAAQAKALAAQNPPATPGTPETQASVSTVVKPVEQANQSTATVVSTPTLAEKMQAVAGVVPPDAPSRAQEVITQPGQTVVDPLKSSSEEGEEEGEEENGEEPQETVVAASNVTSTTPVAPKKRGRPTNAEIAARNAAQVQAPVSPPDDAYMVGISLKGEIDKLKQDLHIQIELNGKLREERDRARAERGIQQASASVAGLTLFVDCYPTKGERPIDFFEWIGPIAAKVAQENSVGDYRQINYTSKALLANAIRETVKTEGLPPGIAVSTLAGGADIALEVLTPLAKQVIKKF